MSVREYNGARYVPLFMGEWDNSNTYEPLSIVMHEGNSYTSRQFVPAGIDIANGVFWAETGNFNAQVEAYRQEVLRYAAEVEAIDVGTMEIIQIDGESSGGNCTPTLVHTASFNALIDTGSLDDDTKINTVLTSKNVGKLDVFIITHYHGDHCKNYEYIMRNWCDTDTKMYVQMEPGNRNNQKNEWISTSNGVQTVNPGYNQYSAAISNLANELGISCVVPQHGATLEFGKMKITFWNTDNSVITDYDTAWCNNNMYDYTQEPYSTLNNYSLVALFEYGNNTYLETGDIEGVAQKFLAPEMKHAMVMRVPHHLKNKNGFAGFYDAVCPEIFIASGNLDVAYDAGTLSDFRASYQFTYMKYRNYNANVYVNWTVNTDIVLKDGSVFSCQGEILNVDSVLNSDYSEEDPGGNSYLPLYAAFPPSYYHARPYEEHEIGLADLLKLKKAMGGGPYMVFFSGTRTSSEPLGSAKIVTEITQIFARAGVTLVNPGTGSGTQVIIKFFDFGVTLQCIGTPSSQSSVWPLYNNNLEIIILEGYTDIDSPFWTVREIGTRNFVKLEGTFTHKQAWNADVAGTWEQYAIQRANNLLVTLSNNRRVNLTKVNNNPMNANTYQGYDITFDSGALEIVSVRIAGTSILISAYNADPNNVDKWKETHPYTASSIEVIF